MPFEAVACLVVDRAQPSPIEAERRRSSAHASTSSTERIENLADDRRRLPDDPALARDSADPRRDSGRRRRTSWSTTLREQRARCRVGAFARIVRTYARRLVEQHRVPPRLGSRLTAVRLDPQPPCARGGPARAPTPRQPSPSSCSNSRAIARRAGAAVPREGDAVIGVRHGAAWKDPSAASRSVFQPTWSMWRCVRKTTSTSSGAHPALGEPGQALLTRHSSPPGPPGRRRCRRGSTCPHRSEMTASTEAPARARRRGPGRAPVRLPVVVPGKSFRQLPQLTHRVDERLELDQPTTT